MEEMTNAPSAVRTEEITALLEQKSFSELRKIFSEMTPPDIADLFDGIAHEFVPVLYRILPKELAAEVFVEMDSDFQKVLIDAFSDYELRQVLDELYLDDTVDLIEEMPANVVSRMLRNSTAEARRSINELLQYPENSAGSIMTTEYVNLKPDMTVDEAFELIRKVAIDKETIYTCYVTCTNRRLCGVVSAKTLMLSERNVKIQEIMERNVISVTTQTDKEEASLMFGRYDFLALPVVDTEDRLVGIITVDDAIDAFQDAVEEDFAKMAAITPPSDATYLKTPAFSIFKARIPWLILLTLSATFTGMIISSFEAALSACVALTAFIPMLMGTGGNSGSQSSVTVIRGLSMGEIKFSDFFRVVWKETRVALLCAGCLALITYLKIYFVDYLLLHSLTDTEALTVPLAVCLTLAITVLVAKLIGCTLPILAKKIGFDPTVMASPLITTIIDAVSLVCYFLIATLLIPGLI